MKRMPTRQNGNGGRRFKVVLCDGAWHQCRDLDEPHIAVEVEHNNATEVRVELRTAPRYLSIAGQQQLTFLDAQAVVTTQTCCLIDIPLDAVPKVVRTLQQVAQDALIDREEVKPEPPRTVDRLAKLLGVKQPDLDEQMAELRAQRQQYRYRQLA